MLTPTVGHSSPVTKQRYYRDNVSEVVPVTVQLKYQKLLKSSTKKL